MESNRVPVVNHHYNDLRSSAVNTFPGSASLHDLNAVDVLGGTHNNNNSNNDVVDNDNTADDVTHHSLDNNNDDDNSSAVDCMNETYRSSLPFHSIGVEDDQSSCTRGSYDILTIEDISPIETARSRFMDIIVNNFINSHIIEVSDVEGEFIPQTGQNKVSKRKSKEKNYEGDSQYALPLMYVANLYETLVNEVNLRLSNLNGMREKSIGVALEAAGGLYRKLANKFPKKGACTFKRRELATSLETRSRFPELVIQEEKRVRFVVVNGLSIHEKPTNINVDDAHWFKRLTGRNEVAVSSRDYKFYAPRHKYRRGTSNSISNIPALFPCTDSSSSPLGPSEGYHSSVNDTQTKNVEAMGHEAHPQPHFHLSHQHMNHQSYNPPPHQQLPDEIAQSNIAQHMACLPSISHVGSRLHVLPTTPAKFCDECGTVYLRDTSKFCSECGTKRLGT